MCGAKEKLSNSVFYERETSALKKEYLLLLCVCVCVCVCAARAGGRRGGSLPDASEDLLPVRGRGDAVPQRRPGQWSCCSEHHSSGHSAPNSV